MSPSLHNTKIIKHAMQAKKSKKKNQRDGKASTDSQEINKPTTRRLTKNKTAVCNVTELSRHWSIRFIKAITSEITSL